MANISTQVGYQFIKNYKTKEGRTVSVHIFKTDPSKHGIAGGLSDRGLKHIKDLTPDNSILKGKKIVIKTNGNYQDAGGSPINFHGIWLAGGILCKDGKKDLSLSAPSLADNLGEGLNGWYRYSPSLCIASNPKTAKIHWFSTQSGGQRITIAQGYNQYVTIIPGQHCLVHNSKSVFEDVCYSWEGLRIADWSDLDNQWYHHNSTIGGYAYNIKGYRARTLFGHAPDGSCFLVCVCGAHDWGAPQDNDPGMNLREAAKFMLDLGCDYALNMDGGTPSQMYDPAKTADQGFIYCTYTKEEVNKGTYFPVGSSICVYEK